MRQIPHRATPLCLLALLAFVGPAAAEEEPAPTLQARIAAQVQPYVEAGELMGVVVGVADGKGRQVFGFGRLDADRPGPPDGDTVYEIGSISKVFTGVLLASLIEDGTLTLDQPVAGLLPASAKLKPFEAGPLTLRGLTTHSSGLPRMPANFHPANPRDPYADYTAEQLYASLNNHDRRKAPGKAHAYSNLGAGLLGHLLTLKTRKSYEALLAERITKPLGMTSTSLALSDAMQKRLAPPHDAGNTPNTNWDLGILAGAGGIRSTVSDMLRFAAADLADGERPVDAALARARKQHFRAPGGGQAMGMGWHLAGGAHWHNGQTGGYHSMLVVDRKRGFVVVMLSNTAIGTIDGIANKIGQILIGKDVKPPEIAKAVAVDAKVLADYVGRYELMPTFILTVTVAAGKLRVQATGQPQIPTIAKSDTTFFNASAKAEFTFERGDDGKVARLVLRQHGQTHAAKRLAD